MGPAKRGSDLVSFGHEAQNISTKKRRTEARDPLEIMDGIDLDGMEELDISFDSEDPRCPLKRLNLCDCGWDWRLKLDTPKEIALAQLGKHVLDRHHDESFAPT